MLTSYAVSSSIALSVFTSKSASASMMALSLLFSLSLSSLRYRYVIFSSLFLCMIVFCWLDLVIEFIMVTCL